MKILLADDNKFYSRICESMLRHWGYEVVAASDGDEAWRLLQQPDAPKLALLDWMMPGLDGIELCRRVRATPDLKSLYIVMITVKEGKESVVTALESGADDYIRKPFDPDELLARLRVGTRMVEMQAALAANITELELALSGAQKMEAIGRLAGGLAHDFNNLLTIVAGGSELLMNNPRCDAQQRDLAHMIKDAADRGAALTRQLLAFSRKQILKPVVLDLNQLIANTEKMLRRLIGEDIELVAQPSSSIGPIKADPVQIEQVIINLVVNARDAMPNGGKIVIATDSVCVQPEPGKPHRPSVPTALVRLTVSDTGCGMDRHTRAHIFEPFFTTKAAGKGTGLGLATVYGIVKQSGGFVEVDSAPGQGATFAIYLPPTRDLPEAAPVKPAVAGHASAGETILLAEDDETVRRMVRDVLRANGYQVLEAANGRDALEQSDRFTNPIHLLLTDTIMPHMGGPQLAGQLSVKRPNTKVLFVSGYPNSPLVEEKVVNSGQPFLQKPFSPQLLLTKVHELLHGVPR